MSDLLLTKKELFMKNFITIIISLMASLPVVAGSVHIKIHEDDKVYCVRIAPYADHNISAKDSLSISCVSKASIAKDLLELEVLQLQKVKLKNDLKPALWKN